MHRVLISVYIRKGFFKLPVIQEVNIITQIALRKLCNKILYFFHTAKLSGHELKKTAVKQKCLSSVYRLAVDAKPVG